MDRPVGNPVGHVDQRQTNHANRRAMIAAALVTAAASPWNRLLAETTAADSDKTFAPKPVIDGRSIRVRMEMEVQGNVNIAKNPLVSRDVDMKLPINSDVVFDYEERIHTTAANKGAAVPVASAAERNYFEAGCDARLNKTFTQQRLRKNLSNLVVHRNQLPGTIYSPTEFLTRTETDLLQTPVASCAVDRWLPTKAVKIGETYFPTIDAIGDVLNLTSARTSDIGIKMVDEDDALWKYELKGSVDGSVNGVPTLVRVVGKMTYDTNSKLCTWLALAMHETREVGVAEPGFDLKTTVKMRRQRLPKLVGLPKTPIRIPANLPQDRMPVEIFSRRLGVAAIMNRDWKSMSDVPGAAVWRMSTDDRSIAQCDLRPLPSMTATQSFTLNDFVSEVRKSLGSQLRDIIGTEEKTNDNGLQAMVVRAAGMAEDVPVRWTLVNIRDPREGGRRVLATFTLRNEDIPQFAGSDLQMMATLRMLPMTAKNGENAGESEEPTLPMNVSHKQKPKLGPNRKKIADRPVQSASDVR